MLDAVDSRQYLFHRVPSDLRGDTLFPLNRLRDVYPDLYECLQQNYATRRDIAALRIPSLGNCLWNDVLFFSPVHPSRHLEALEEHGLTLPPEWRRYFRIDAALLRPADAVIYELRTIFWSGAFDTAAASSILERECCPFDPMSLAAFAEVPARAYDYYASVLPGTAFPLFLHLPHILYRGSLDITQPGIEIVEV